jgi:hypothetical protein
MDSILTAPSDYHATEKPYRFAPVRYSEITPQNGVSVALHNDIRKCVVFLGSAIGAEEDAHISPAGTGFLIQGGKKFMRGGTYLVTARHVADQLPYPFSIRLNKKGGGAGLHTIETKDRIKWHKHPDDTVDLAITPYEVPEWADTIYFSLDHALRQEKMETKRIGAGDIAYVVGLFHLLKGEERNLPIVHTGHIAMLPGDEKIPVEGKQVEGYLVQANAISGCSGSPVFVRRGLSVLLPPQLLDRRAHNDSSPLVGEVAGSAWLLGVWQSSWKVKGSEIVSVKSDSDGSFKTMAPLGMGVVVPMSKVIEILEIPELANARESTLKLKSEPTLEATNDSLGITGDDILRTMLNTPHKPQTTPKAKPKRKLAS